RAERVITSPGSDVDLGQVHIELRLVRLHPHGGFAELLGLGPLTLRVRLRHAEVREIKRVMRFERNSAVHVCQRCLRVVVPHPREGLLEFLESLRLQHPYPRIEWLSD